MQTYYQTRREPYVRRLAALKAERESWVSHWQDISAMILPRRGRFLQEDRNKGHRRNRDIIDNTGTIALRTLSSGLMSGVTSPARPWFRLSSGGFQPSEDMEVRRWLATVEKLLREIFNRSNVYNALYSVYEELGAFGTAAMLVYEDYDNVISCETLTAGQYYIAPNRFGRIDTLYREYSLTVAQVVEEFVHSRPGKEDWSRVSPRVRTQWETGQREGWVELLHAIEPNPDYREGPGPATRKKYRSVWIEMGGDPNVLLRESGYDEFPAMVPRWNLAGADMYGHSPAMDALGDVEQLQMEEREKSKAIQKMVSPPLNVPSTLAKQSMVNVLPNGLTYYDAGAGNSPMATPLYQVQPRVLELQQDMEQVRSRIRAAFYADLWLMVSDMDRSGVTATEIDARREEKLLMLGPVLERLHHELLDPLIERTFAIALRAGIVPPPPPGLKREFLRVEYISMLAQAQRAVGTGSIERLLRFVGTLSGSSPQVMDKIDLDQAVDEYADALGAPPSILLGDPEVQKLRQDREKKEQKQQAGATIPGQEQAAKGAQMLSQVESAGKNALSEILGGITGAIA